MLLVNKLFWPLLASLLILGCEVDTEEEKIEVGQKAKEAIEAFPFSDPNKYCINLIAENIGWESKTPCQVQLSHGDQFSAEYSGLVKFRGGSSSKFNKHSFTLHTLEECPILSQAINSSQDFVLNASYIDKTLIRHALSYLTFNMMDEKNKAPNCQFYELYLNGNYQGAYVAMEKVNEAFCGINTSDSTAALLKDGGLFRTGYFVPQEPGNYYHLKFPDIDSVDRSDIPAAFKQWIDFPVFFKADQDEMIDIQNIIDWHILLLVSNNDDGVLKNFYWYKADSTQPWRVIPWDYDHSFGRDGDGTLNIDDRMVKCERNKLLNTLLNDDEYKAKLAHRYFELKNNFVISKEALNFNISELQFELTPLM